MANENNTLSSNRDSNRRRNTLLNRAIVKKISAMLSLMLIVAIMVPVLAFAATGFSNLTYSRNGNVSGSVYHDTYNQGETVKLHFFAPDKQHISSVDAVYSTTYDAAKGTFYNFSANLSSAYNHVTVQSVVYDASGEVVESVYQDVYRDSRRGGGGGGGGGGWLGGSVDGSTINVGADGSVNAFTLTNLLANGDVTLKLSGEFVNIPASALVDAASRTITVTNDNGSYVLPVSLFDLNALATALDVEVDDMNIKVSIADVSSETADDVKAAISAVGGTQVAEAVDFNVVATAANGETAAVDFGKTYVSRSLNASKSVDSKTTTGVLYDATTKKVTFVPSTFSTTDDATVATLKRNGNSVYTVVESNKSFADVASHWSQADVELLANKLVVEGSSDTTFEPERNINRAEFAALVVRSLGLTPVTSATTDFKDVSSSAWYASTVATATYAGIIDGYEDNTFRPDAQITREELAAMVIRAMNYADIATNVANPQSVLSKFTDANKIVWAEKEIAAAVNAGIIEGMTDTTIGSAEKATRAQSTTMLKRFLGLANFIN
ncbi:S-layer homology domain-containing protein [Paenibacillus xerothermodurans]|uniref:S-layer homology domain-containing protein n=1 Tax=Paenibacillus xerothermodurans TaxID=1977292 RepID=A0A2W1NPJ2_PAEXE|nr:S-layer homology domain-containing protein [Paenibacillus xerothermodurans]PZE20823.1 S-layer homology domain-containing protein [Paenibacillus xerothermodurans]